MLDHVLADPVAVGLILAREWHSETELVVFCAITCKVSSFELHGVLELGLVSCKGGNNFLLILSSGDLLLENSELLFDSSLVLLELLHSSHVEHVLALKVGGFEITIAVLHEVGADLLVHD